MTLLHAVSPASAPAYWFNPRQNSAQLIGTYDKTGEMRFESPSSGRNNDWVLVIDDAARELSPLGSSYQNFTPTFGSGLRPR